MADTDVVDPSNVVVVHFGGDQIDINLEELDDDPTDLYNFLEEANCDAWIWKTVIMQYWRKNKLDVTGRGIEQAIALFERQGSQTNLDQMHAMQANIILAYHRRAPKLVLKNARQDRLPATTKDKFSWIDQAETTIGKVGALPSGDDAAAQRRRFIVQELSRGIVQLAGLLIDEASRTFDGVLKLQPNNVIALVGKGRVLYARRSFRESVKCFQRALALSSNMLPDPRIGIGLCAWQIGDKARARKAWERSKEVHPDVAAPRILLSLGLLNDAKDKHNSMEIRAKCYADGIKGLAAIFRSEEPYCASVANALSAFFVERKDWDKAIKAAERTIQYADLRGVISDGYLRLGRIAHLRGDYTDAAEQYSTALERNDKDYLSRAGLGQIHILTNEIPAAIHDFELLLQEKPESLQAILPLASLQASSWPGASTAEVAAAKQKSRDLFERARRQLRAKGPDTANVEEPEMWVEIAKLWQTDDPTKAREAYETAVKLARHSPEGVDPKLLNALAVIRHLHGGDAGRAEAMKLYQEALTLAVKKEQAGIEDNAEVQDNQVVETTVLYNLARCYEATGEQSEALKAYQTLLGRHPEYVDAKARLAHLKASSGEKADTTSAHIMLKEALLSQLSNLNLRAYYTYFLTNTLKDRNQAVRFAQSTVKEHDKHDLYSLCAVAMEHYNIARENRDGGPEAAKKRKNLFISSATAFDKVLSLDPTCAIAAMGLAIIIAEDALGSLSGGTPAGTDMNRERERNASEALAVFSRIRESIGHWSIFVNMGHCYFTLEQFDKAIESYELASRYSGGKETSILQHLARSWYAKANNEQNADGMETALNYAQQALESAPGDKTIRYNIAVIQQKLAELLLSLPPNRRTLTHLQTAIREGYEAQGTFYDLVQDQSPVLPFAKELADQRWKYGDGLLKRGGEQVEKQQEYEEEQEMKRKAAQRMREEEARLRKEAEDARLAEIQREAQVLSEARKQARELVSTWNLAEALNKSDDEAETKPKRGRKAKAAPVVAAPATGSDTDAPPPEPKPRRRRAKSKTEDEESEALFTGDEAEQAPAKVRPKRVLPKEEDEEEQEPTSKRRKKIKSKATISDSDEEMD